MPILTKDHSKVASVRLPEEIIERVAEFAATAGLTVSGALRVLIEIGLDTDVALDELSAISFNAKAEVLQKFDRIITKAIERFQNE